MAGKPDAQARMWALIVSYGLQDEYERDWLGRVKSRKSKRYLKAEITPELAQAIADAGNQVGAAAGNARAALTAGRASVQRLLSKQQLPDAG